MSLDPLDLGAIANDGTGTPLRSGGQIINDNFSEVDVRLIDAQAAGDQGIAAGATADAKAVAAQATADAAIPQSAAGVSIAQLVAGLVPPNQLPSYVDDVLEFPDLASFPVTGETGKIYVAINDGDSLSNPTKQYRWSGSVYVLIPSAPGSTDEVAEGSTNLYFTPARVRAAPLTGFVLGTNSTVLASDTVLGAFGKLQAQVNAVLDKQVTIIQYKYIATAGQTVFTGPDSTGNPLSFPPASLLLVNMQGLALWAPNDYTTTGSDTLTLIGMPAVAGDEISIIAFTPFDVANHYTKAEDDARFFAKTDVIPVSQGGTGKTTEFRKGFIDGLRMIYVGRRALTVSAGAAYVNSLGRIIELAADKVFTGLTFTANTVHHVYLFENAGVADIEISTAVPVKYYGSSYHKTGDTSRRYIGSFLATTTTSMGGFFHDIQTNRISFIEGNPGLAPWNLWSGFNVTTPVLVTGQPQLLVPIQTVLKVRLAVQGGAVTFAPADQLTAPGGPNWGDQMVNGAELDITVARSGANLGLFYAWVPSAASTNAYCTGYIFER